MEDGIAGRGIKQLTMRRVIKQWCASKYLTTDSQRGKKNHPDLLSCPLLWCKHSHQS